jgi:hypothetical protein
METITDAVKRITDFREAGSGDHGAGALLDELNGLFTRHVFVRADHLYSLGALAELFSIRVQTVSSWVRNPTADFPLPVTYPGMGPIWDVVDVIRWWIKYTPKGKKVGSLPDALILKFSE